MAQSRFLLITALAALTFLAVPAQADDTRTANRTASGVITIPEEYFVRPEHYEFLPLVSNHDSLHQHPQQWDGQDWETTAWDGADWTADSAVNRLFAGRVFEHQFIRNGKKYIDNPRVQARVPVLVVGPKFYKLSDLDQRRSLKLVTDQANLFDRGYEMVELVDWSTKKPVGSYTPKGMFLN